jgi:hypothetical protein
MQEKVITIITHILDRTCVLQEIKIAEPMS